MLSGISPDGVERPITFISKVLSETERKYSAVVKEALEIYWAVKKLSQYLLGRHFKLVTDHKPLLAIFGEKVFQL